MARSNKNFLPQKEELVGVALDLFLQNGYENTTITQIMKASGLSKGGLYHYFSSKEEILDEAINHGLKQDCDLNKEQLDALPQEEKLFFFLKSGFAPNDISQKLIQYSVENRNSYAAYRIRESHLHLVIPTLQEIFAGGIAAGLYKMEYPDQMAELCVLMVQALVETNYLPYTDLQGRKKRLQAFITLVRNSIETKEEHWKRVEEVISEGILIMECDSRV